MKHIKDNKIESALFGIFNPAHPEKIEGYFSDILFADPVEIDAPIELVWSVITDFHLYPLWNPLIRSFQLDTTAKLGEIATFTVSWGPYMKDGLNVPVSNLKVSLTQHEKITVWQPNSCLAYADDLGVWHRAERTQYISALPNGHTCYYTYERWAGLITPLIRLAYAEKTRAAFNAANMALKMRAEALVKGMS